MDVIVSTRARVYWYVRYKYEIRYNDKVIIIVVALVWSFLLNCVTNKRKIATRPLENVETPSQRSYEVLEECVFAYPLPPCSPHCHTGRAPPSPGAKKFDVTLSLRYNSRHIMEFRPGATVWRVFFACVVVSPPKNRGNVSANAYSLKSCCFSKNVIQSRYLRRTTILASFGRPVRNNNNNNNNGNTVRKLFHCVLCVCSLIDFSPNFPPIIRRPLPVVFSGKKNREAHFSCLLNHWISRRGRVYIFIISRNVRSQRQFRRHVKLNEKIMGKTKKE